MKITDSIKNVTTPAARSGTTGKADAGTTTAGSSAVTATSVNSRAGGGDSIASTSPTLQALQSSIANTGTFNTQKVEAIKLAIAGGQFSVDASKVASELITSVRSLLANGNQA